MNKKPCNTQNKLMAKGKCKKCKNTFRAELEWICGPKKEKTDVEIAEAFIKREKRKADRVNRPWWELNKQEI